MNTILIIFLVLVIIIAILLAIQFYNPNYLVRKSTSLNTSIANSQSIIPVTLIDNPGSVRYFYEGWFFINANQPIQTDNVLFNRGNNFVVTLNGSTLNLYVNNNGTDSVVSSGGVLTNASTPITLLSSIHNFPFQKWTQLVINVDGQTIDIYIDGKFVQSVKSSSPIITNTTDPITYGNQYTLGFFTKFRRPVRSINPQGVWSSYMMGSGQNSSISSDHLNLQITKNQTILLDQRLF